MSGYRIQKILSYADAIAEELHGISQIEPQRYSEWATHVKEMNEAHRAFEGQHLRAGQLDDAERKRQLLTYANAVRNAAYYVYMQYKWDYRETALTSDRDSKGLKEHFESLKTAYRYVNPKGGIVSPLPELDCSRALPGLGQDLTVEQMGRYGLFLASPQFQALERYLANVLHEDQRDHSFLGFDLSEKRKPAVLSQLICDLRALKSVEEAAAFLRDFYTKGEKFGTKYEGCSRFDILNQGQNVTTRFFSVFGKQTTTMQLINQLSNLILSDLIPAIPAPAPQYMG